MTTSLLLATLLTTPQDSCCGSEAKASAQEETCACQAMPSFSLTASDGLTYTQKSLTKKSTVVFFLSAGCPHNPKAAPDLNRFKALVGQQVGVVAMTNLDAAKAKAYAKELGLKIPLLADTDGTTMKSFGAKHSLDFALICAKDKKVEKVWEGYSRDIFGEVLAKIPDTGGPAIKADLSVFPKGRQSGCGF